MFKRILVPLDGSELAERALNPAMAIAEMMASDVVLLCVPEFEKVVLGEPAVYGRDVKDNSYNHLSYRQAEEYLNHICQSRRLPGVTMRPELIDSEDVAGAIVDTAAVQNIDLIVMSTHGYTGFTRWVLGSITERVSRHAHCPVLVVRQGGPTQRLLVPLDGSELAEQALEPALALTQALNGQLFLLRVESWTEVDPATAHQLNRVERGLGERLYASFEDEAEAYLETVVSKWGVPKIAIRRAVTTGQAAPEIIQFAQDRQIDLIVMATHGRSGLSRWVYGSVTEKVLRGSERNLLIVRPSS
jgi:nucleotide-binding universal stress UspA family protein